MVRQEPRERARHPDQRRAQDVRSDQVEGPAQTRKRGGGEADSAVERIERRVLSRIIESCRVDVDGAHLPDTHQTHRNREHARPRADVQRVLETLRRAKSLEGRERAISRRVMTGAEGLSWIDYDLQTPRGYVGVPRWNDEQAASDR